MLALTATNFPLLDAIWMVIIFFAWVIWFWLLITIFADLFRRSDTSGWVKAAWVLVLLVLPFVGVLIYLIAEGRHMAERRQRQAEAARADFDSYVRATAGSGQATDQIARGKQLLDSGAITQEEYEALKRRALA